MTAAPLLWREDDPAPASAPTRSAAPIDRSAGAFVGRQDELDALVDAVAGARLVSVTGVGGIGKTRLCLEALPRLGERADDGARFVDLSAVERAGLVVSTVARAVDAFDAVAEAAGGDELEAYLLATLAMRAQVLVFDNCEHLVDEASRLVQSILLSCPDIRVAATTREPLGLAGEVRLPLGPLQAAAEDLFLARAQAAGAILGEDARPQVRAICDRLDGIPLAIELVAARTASLPLEDLGRRLGDALGLGGAVLRGVPDRQRTMSATLDWSHDLAGAAEQVLFRRLSVFSGGWTLAAAEAVAAGDDLDPAEVFRPLAALVDRSLVVFDVTDQRYRFLEPVRQYAAGRLEASGETEGIVAAHLRHQIRVARRQGADIGGAAGAAQLANHRIAIQRALTADNAAGAMALIVLLGWAWNLLQVTGEQVELSEAALALPSAADAPPALRRGVHALTAATFALDGRCAPARRHVDAALALGDRSGGAAGTDFALAAAIDLLADDPLAVLTLAEDDAVAHHAPVATLLAVYAAWWLTWQDRLDEALVAADRAVAHDDARPGPFHAWARWQALYTHLLAGEAPTAAQIRPLKDNPGPPIGFSGVVGPLVLAGSDQLPLAVKWNTATIAYTSVDARIGYHEIALRTGAVLRARAGDAEPAATLLAAAERLRSERGFPRRPHLERLIAEDVAPVLADLPTDVRNRAESRAVPPSGFTLPTS